MIKIYDRSRRTFWFDPAHIISIVQAENGKSFGVHFSTGEAIIIEFNDSEQAASAISKILDGKSK